MNYEFIKELNALLVSSVRKTQSLAIAADLCGFKFRKKGSCLKNYGYKTRDVLCYLFCFVLVAVTVAVMLYS